MATAKSSLKARFDPRRPAGSATRCGYTSRIWRPRTCISTIAAVLFAAFFSQPLILLVAGGAAYRAFEKSSAELPVNHGVTAYFMVLVATLGYLSALAPLGAAR